MKRKIAVLPGDGIGKEIIEGAMQVLEAIGKRFGHEFHITYGLIGGAAIDAVGTPLPNETVEICKGSEAILLGAVGGPKWDTLPGHQRPEKGLLGIRKALDLYANLRPVGVFKSLAQASPLKEEIVNKVDMVIVRELTGGLYFGKPSERLKNEHGEDAVVDTLYYEKKEIERIIRKAFEIAKNRRKKVTSVDKANVLESSRVWREVAEEVGKDYPDVQLEHMLVDNAAMQLIRNPGQFDVIVTENMFGDILSDEASVLTGSLGMLPSASLSEHGPGLYEPVHGSAPDIAGQNKANPLATILSLAMLLRYSLSLEKEANAVEQAVTEVLEAGYRTADIANSNSCVLSTTKMVDQVILHLKEDEVITGIKASFA